MNNAKVDRNPIKVISYLISTNAIFTGPSIFITFGMMYAIFFGVAAILTLITSYLLLKFINRKSSHYVAPLSPKGGLKFFYLFFSFTQFFMLGLGGGTIISILFHIPLIIGIITFFIIGYLYSFISTLPNFRHQFKLAAIFIVTTSIIIYSYITEDVVNIYNGIRLYHPYLLYVNWSDLFFYTLAVFIIFMCKLIMNHTYLIQVKEGQISFKTSFLIGIVWTSLSISFLVICISVIYQGGFDSLYTIFNDVLVRMDNTLLAIVSIVLLFTLVDTFRTEKEYFEDLNVRFEKYIPKFLVLIMLLVSINENWSQFYYVFFMFGIMSSAFLPVIILNLLSSENQKPVGSVVGILSAIVGYCLLIWLNFVVVILIVFVVSGVVSHGVRYFGKP